MPRPRSTAYFDAWQSVDSDDVSRGLSSDLSVEALAKMEALAKEEGVPLAVATRVFGKDGLKPLIEELNEMLVA